MPAGREDHPPVSKTTRHIDTHRPSAAGKNDADPRSDVGVQGRTTVVTELDCAAGTLGFVPLPPRHWLFLVITLLGHAERRVVAKTGVMGRFGEGW